MTMYFLIVIRQDNLHKKQSNEDSCICGQSEPYALFS